LQFTDELEDGYLVTAPVGSFRPNAFGLHDVHGNITEACRDTVIDSAEPRGGDGYREGGDVRALSARGGCYYDRPDSARMTSRGFVGRDARQVLLGVRPVRAVR